VRLVSRFEQVAGLRLHARVGGAGSGGRPVVCVHGIGVSSRYFVPLARELALTSPVAAVDLPGFGRSERPPRALAVPQLADALRAWLDALGLDRPALVANSMGCQVAVDLAVRAPDRVDRLVLVGPTIDPSARTAARQAARLLLDCTREPPSLLAIIALDYVVFGPLRLARTARFALDDRIEAKLPRVRAPALVVRGEHDGLVPQRWAAEAASLLPRGRLAVVPGKAHAVHFSAAARVAALVRSFLEEGDESGRGLAGRVEHGHVSGAGEDDEPGGR
jgi:2-hydroxy-6-oxonona-2,4-dienedioate hydrolase